MKDNPSRFSNENLDPEMEKALKEFREAAEAAFEEGFDNIMETLTSLRTETMNPATKIYYAMQTSFISGGLWAVEELIDAIKAKEEDGNGN